MKLAKLSMPRRRVRGSGMSSVSGIGSQTLHPRRVDADGELVAEQIVRDPHLVAIGVGAEGEQRGVLRLPAEAADAAIAGAALGDDGGASADAVAVAIVGIGQRQDRVVGDRLDQAGAEHRDRDPADDDVGVGRDHRLAAVAGQREQVDQRLAGGVEALVNGRPR